MMWQVAYYANLKLPLHFTDMWIDNMQQGDRAEAMGRGHRLSVWTTEGKAKTKGT